MMESHKLFPKGHHHDLLDEKPDLSGTAPFYTRTQRPTKYYIIDFGLALHYDGSESSLAVPIVFGGDRTVPEFKDLDKPQNPFMTDIYLAGNFIREHFIQVTHFFLFLYILIRIKCWHSRETLPYYIWKDIKALSSCSLLLMTWFKTIPPKGQLSMRF